MLGDGCGRLIAPQNIDALFLALQQLVGDDEGRLRMAERAYARVKQRYALAIVYARLRSLWYSAAEGSVDISTGGLGYHRQEKADPCSQIKRC
jgi:glycosyltransferase involved in cell wall biosynthesis